MTPTPRNPSRLLRAVVLAGGLSLFSGALLAQAPTYFPLGTGDIWLFRSVTVNPQTNSIEFDFQTMRVRGTEKIDNKDYFDVSYFGRELILRADPATGEVVQYDRAAGAELPWLSLAIPAGGSFSTSLNACSSQAQIVSRTGMVSIPDGDPGDVVQIDFTSSCAGTGTARQYYAPNVGLIRSEEASPNGPRAYRLIYYRAGTTIGTETEVSFSVGLDSPPHYVGTSLGVRLSLRNTSFADLALHFPSSQSYDLQVLNSQGDIVYTWSGDKIFDPVSRDETLLSSSELAFGISVPLASFAPGHYIARTYLTTDPRQYLAELGFDVVSPGK